MITKGPKERYVIDGFQLDEIAKELNGYTYVTEIIDYFSKFIKSYVIRENNAQNALLCIKDYWNFVCFSKILQSNKELEYKNKIIKDFCDFNDIK